MFLISALGVKINEDNEQITNIEFHDDYYFYYEQNWYKKLLDFDAEQLFKDIKIVTEFSLHSETDHCKPVETIISLFYTTATTNDQISFGLLERRQRICDQFLVKLNGDHLISCVSDIDSNEIEVIDVDSSPNISHKEFVNNLYDQVRKAHPLDLIDKSIPREICHKYLNPVLFPFQKDSVRWMIQRERIPNYLLTEYIPVHPIDNNNVQLLLNTRTFTLAVDEPDPIQLPSGGILADEMGLGKTVEVLALIMLNQNPMKPSSFTSLRKKRKFDSEPLLCLCGKKSETPTIKCRKCGYVQHRKCVFTDEEANENDLGYVCPSCWKYEDPVKSSATIIVIPGAIKHQWMSEIRKHVSNKNFRVLLYEGVKYSGWISPREMAQYDIVLTDYRTMSSEQHYTNTETDRKNRLEKKILVPVTPLSFVHWWRVCLDEAQTVESVYNKVADMVKSLLAVHRWSVTGTPINNKLDNLYGQFFFLGCYPYDLSKECKKLLQSYQNGCTKPLVDILTKIMRRTRKLDVLDQIRIPQQTEIIHYVTMSDLETFFYMSQHEKYSSAFNKVAIEISKSTKVTKLDAHTFKLLMDPLLKIRQDCSVPRVYSKAKATQKQLSFKTDTTYVKKKVVTSKELLIHLLEKNESYFKTNLRTIVTNLNRLAGISIIRGNYTQAIKFYKSVLRRVEEQQDSNMRIDSLQHIHALHNMLSLYDELKVSLKEIGFKLTELNGMRKSIADLERKYINNCALLIKEQEDQRNVIELKIIKLVSKLSDLNGSWWRAIIYELDDEQQTQFLNSLKIEMITSGEAIENEIKSMHGIDLVLYTWWNSVLESRENTVKSFESLEFFTENIQLKTNLSTTYIKLFDDFLKSALKCHLKLGKVNEVDDPSKNLNGNQEAKRKSKPIHKNLCLICKTKIVLQSYGCRLFDKRLENDDDMDNSGTWASKYEEKIMWAIFDLGKTRKLMNKRLLKEAKATLKLLDHLKIEFKRLSKLWVEINYTASAYDELNMCKSRLIGYNPHKLSDEQRIDKLYISIFELDVQAAKFQAQMNEAENNFEKFAGRIKYLKHLEEKTEEVGYCPICTKKPKGKYCMLQCGHIMCLVCLEQMRLYQKNNLTCCVCRNNQRYENVFYVTLKENHIDEKPQIFTIVGDFSTKIQQILLTILKLRAEEPNVKIVIFSNWDMVLDLLKSGLILNEISFTTFFAYNLNTDTCLNEFKNHQKTCLLLPLRQCSKGLNLTEATHIFLVDPILDPSEELQTIGRIHRIGQTKPTFVHKFIVRNTIEETINKTISNDTDNWRKISMTVDNLKNLFILPSSQRPVVVVD